MNEKCSPPGDNDKYTNFPPKPHRKWKTQSTYPVLLCILFLPLVVDGTAEGGTDGADNVPALAVGKGLLAEVVEEPQPEHDDHSSHVEALGPSGDVDDNIEDRDLLKEGAWPAHG